MTLFDPQRNFLFIHIYRTGGNTLRRCITRPGSIELGSPHATTADTMQLLNAELWQNAYKFTIVRHPFTWLLSTWAFVERVKNHREHQHAARGFIPYLEWVADVGLSQQNGFMQDRHQMQHEFATGLNHAYRYEDSPTERICEDLGLPVPKEVPRLVAGRYDSAELTDDARRLIRRVWARDFEELGYE